MRYTIDILPYEMGVRVDGPLRDVYTERIPIDATLGDLKKQIQFKHGLEYVELVGNYRGVRTSCRNLMLCGDEGPLLPSRFLFNDEHIFTILTTSYIRWVAGLKADIDFIASHRGESELSDMGKLAAGYGSWRGTVDKLSYYFNSTPKEDGIRLDRELHVLDVPRESGKHDEVQVLTTFGQVRQALAAKHGAGDVVLIFNRRDGFECCGEVMRVDDRCPTANYVDYMRQDKGTFTVLPASYVQWATLLSRDIDGHITLQTTTNRESWITRSADEQREHVPEGPRACWRRKMRRQMNAHAHPPTVTTTTMQRADLMLSSRMHVGHDPRADLPLSSLMHIAYRVDGVLYSIHGQPKTITVRQMRQLIADTHGVEKPTGPGLHVEKFSERLEPLSMNFYNAKGVQPTLDLDELAYFHHAYGYEVRGIDRETWGVYNDPSVRDYWYTEVRFDFTYGESPVVRTLYFQMKDTIYDLKYRISQCISEFCPQDEMSSPVGLELHYGTNRLSNMMRDDLPAFELKRYETLPKVTYGRSYGASWDKPFELAFKKRGVTPYHIIQVPAFTTMKDMLGLMSVKAGYPVALPQLTFQWPCRASFNVLTGADLASQVIVKKRGGCFPIVDMEVATVTDAPRDPYPPGFLLHKDRVPLLRLLHRLINVEINVVASEPRAGFAPRRLPTCEPFVFRIDFETDMELTTERDVCVSVPRGATVRDVLTSIGKTFHKSHIELVWGSVTLDSIIHGDTMESAIVIRNKARALGTALARW
jgi:hypothetical protein